MAINNTRLRRRNTRLREKNAFLQGTLKATNSLVRIPKTNAQTSGSNTSANTGSNVQVKATPQKSDSDGFDPIEGDFLFKPGGENTGNLVILTNSGQRGSQVTIKDPDGNVIDQGTSSGISNGNREHFRFPKPGSQYPKGTIVEIQNADGSITRHKIDDPSMRVEASGASSGGTAVAKHLNFPEPSLASYENIKKAKYKYVNPFDFAKKFGDVNREEIRKNYDLSKELALDQLDTELQGLRSYVEGSAALKREEISADNEFNQEQRTKQIDEVLPEARGQLAGQAERAEAYAEGRVPDSISDRALELGVRSRAADMSSAAGFGAQGSVSKKVSDLMSAENRINLSQYGDQLLSANINQKANLFLAPTSYSTAGSEINVMPEVGAGRALAGYLSEANAATIIPMTTAFSATVQQRQFKTTLSQRTKEFNAANKLQVSMANAEMLNKFKLAEFGYEASYAGMVAGAANRDRDIAFGLSQQEAYRDTFQSSMGDAQDAGTIKDIAAATTAITGLISAGAGLLSGDGGGSTGEGAAGIASAPPTGGGTTGGEATAGTGAAAAPSGGAGSAGGGGGTTSVAAPAGGPVDTTPQYSGTASAPVAPEVSSFNRSSGYTVPTDNTPVTQQLVNGGDVALANVGLSTVPAPGMVPAGVNRSGQPVYTNAKLAESNDTTTGSAISRGLASILDPFDILSKEDRTALDVIGTAANDMTFLADLNAAKEAGDGQKFISLMMERVSPAILDELKADPQSRQGLDTAFSTFRMFENWNKLSPAQKSLAVANVGTKGYKFATGESLGNKFIIKPELDAAGKVKTPGLNLGQAISAINTGVNIYSLANNWKQLNTINKVIGGANTATSMMYTANHFGLLGKGVTGATTAVNQAALTKAGWTAAQSQGVGAITAKAGTAIPSGYTAVAEKGGQVLATPASSTMTYVNNIAGGLGVAAGAYQIYQGWGQGGAKGRLNAGIGGASIAAGLYTMGAIAGPFAVAGIIAASVLAGSIKTGKHAHQIERDSVRSDLIERGFMSKDWKVELADGTLADMSADGHTGKHSVTNSELLADDHKERHGKADSLAAYEVDYTNDLDYAANMGTNALMRLMYGGKARNTEQLGGQLCNAAISNVGFNQAMTSENYTKVMQNVRGFYAKNGIEDKASAYQLSNQMFAEGRIDETDLVTMQQGISMVFNDDGYELASSLMNGRHSGINAIDSKEEYEPTTKTPGGKEPTAKEPVAKPFGTQAAPEGVGDAMARKPTQDTAAALGGQEMQDSNAADKIKNVASSYAGKKPIEEDLKPISIDELPEENIPYSKRRKQSKLSRDKESLRSLNARRYSSMSASA